MTWLWLTALWLVLAWVAGVWLGAALRTAERDDGVRRQVEQALGRELVDR